jgi:hypothetical protein
MDREVSSIKLKVQLFDSIVMPVLQYGCEIWGTQSLQNPTKPTANNVQQVQNLFLRQVTGNWVRRSVSTQLLCAEYGCRPVAWRWCKLVCRYWNRVLNTKYSLLRDAFHENLAHAVHLRPSSRDQSWCFEVLQMLRKCVPDIAQAVSMAVVEDRWEDVPQIDVTRVLQAWKDAWWVWPQDADPRESSGTAAAYCQWMSTDVDQPAPYVLADSPIINMHMAALARFRLGVHHLNVSTGRWAGVSKSDRLCPRCAGQHSEDEKHVLLECYWYYPLREKFRRLYRGAGPGGHPACMQRLLNHPNQAKVAHLVHLIDERHQEPLCDVMFDGYQDDLCLSPAA